MQDVITPQINILAHVVPLTRPPFTFLCAIVIFMLLCVVCRSDLLLQTYVSWMRTESCGWLIRAWRRPSGLTVFLSMIRLPFFTGKDVTRWFSSLTFLSHTSFLSHQSVYFDCLLIICLPYCFCHTLHRVLQIKTFFRCCVMYSHWCKALVWVSRFISDSEAGFVFLLYKPCFMQLWKLVKRQFTLEFFFLLCCDAFGLWS